MKNETKTTQREVDGIIIPTVKKELVDCNIIEVECGTTGCRGGDSGHGGRTYFRIEDCASTDMRLRYKDSGEWIDVRYPNKIEIVFGGDSELCTFAQALKFAYDQLKEDAMLTFKERMRLRWWHLKWAIQRKWWKIKRKLSSRKGVG